MPLPANCPMEFACMPEHFIEDAMDLLIFTSRIPKALDGFILVSFLWIVLLFIIFYYFLHQVNGDPKFHDLPPG